MCGLISTYFTDCNIAVYDGDVDTINSSIILLLSTRNKNSYIYFQMFVGTQFF